MIKISVLVPFNIVLNPIKPVNKGVFTVPSLLISSYRTKAVVVYLFIMNNPSGFIPGDVVTLTLTLSHTALSATAAFDLLVGVSIPLICSNAKVVSVSNDDLAVSDRILQSLNYCTFILKA